MFFFLSICGIDGRIPLNLSVPKLTLLFAVKCRSDVEYVQTMLFLNNGVAAPNFEYELKGTPCEKVRDDSQPEAVPKDVQRLFPLDGATPFSPLVPRFAHHLS